MFGDNFVHNCTKYFRTLFVHFTNCEMSILSNDSVHLFFNASVMTEGRPDLSASWTSVRPFLNIVHHFRTLAAFVTCSPYTAISLRLISLGLTFSACKNRITPRTSQSAGFDIGAFIVTTRYTHNVKKFAAPTAPVNYLHSTEHTTWLIWCNETTARVVCANVLYFPNNPRMK